MYDFHIHSDFSMDCRFLMEEMVAEAINKNMKSICFTDHIDFDLTENGLDFVFRPKDYFKKIKQMKYKYMNEIEILAGVEIGMQPHLKGRYREFLKDNLFDFIIMSVHSINKTDIYADDFIKGKEPLEALCIYYEYLYRSIEIFDDFDVVGHLDYIDRYFEDFSILPDFKEYRLHIEKILKLIIHRGKGIEINTAGMKHGLGYYHPKNEILTLYRDLGGEIITIGSDAHSPEYIGYEYKEAEKLLSKLGFKYIYIFKERKKFPIHIG